MDKTKQKELLELEILKHVEGTPKLNNRLAAAKLECSVKLAHELLKKMVDRGLLHVKKLHSRRWDYFLTPKGVAEKARLTYEFLQFSMRFYHEARKTSSQLCRELHESGVKEIALIGTGDLAEIVYLSSQQWNLEVVGVFEDSTDRFIKFEVQELSKIEQSYAEAFILCMYDPEKPLNENYIPDQLSDSQNIYSIFGGKICTRK